MDPRMFSVAALVSQDSTRFQKQSDRRERHVHILATLTVVRLGLHPATVGCRCSARTVGSSAP